MFFGDPENAFNAQQATEIEPSRQVPAYVLRIAAGENYTPDVLEDPDIAHVTVISESPR